MANPQNRALWWALVASLLIYVVVAHAVNVPPGPDVQVRVVAPILALLSVGFGVGSLIYRRRALSAPIQSGELDPATAEGRQRAFVPFVLNLVVSETVGVYGLVLAFLSGDPAYSMLFSSAALVLMFFHRPTAPDLVPPLSGHPRADDPRPDARG